jgi:dTDP-glucose pyrophosphorylase
MNRYYINELSTIIDALRRLNELSGGVMTLIAVDQDGVMTGTLTDGDVRRALLGGAQLTDPITVAMRRSFAAMRGKRPDVEAMKQARAKGIKLLPLLDDDGRVIEAYDLNVTRSVLPLRAILMAGGKGERLRPLTLATPKPLLEVGGKAIIDYNIEALARVGITDVTVTTRYLADMIALHFANPVAGVKVKCVKEEHPLGTIGAAALVPHSHPAGDTLVMNSDLLTTISFEDMYLRHTSENAAITVAAVPYAVSVPYAILATDGPRVTSIEEKPTYSHYANAGIYIVANRLLDALPADERVDATDLIGQAIAAGEKVVYFPINGTWIDIGTPTDFRLAQDLMRHHNDLQR